MMQNVLASRSVTARRHPSARDHAVRHRREPPPPSTHAPESVPPARPSLDPPVVSPRTTPAGATTAQGLDFASTGSAKSP